MVCKFFREMISEAALTSLRCVIDSNWKKSVSLFVKKSFFGHFSNALLLQIARESKSDLLKLLLSLKCASVAPAVPRYTLPILQTHINDNNVLATLLHIEDDLVYARPSVFDQLEHEIQEVIFIHNNIFLYHG